MIEASKLLRTALMVMIGICKRAMISIFKKALGSFTSDVDTLPEIFGAIHEREEEICD